MFRLRTRPDARWRLRLTGPTVLGDAGIVGRASAAPPGKVFRPRSRPDARWRLRLTGPTVRQAGASSVGRASAAPPGRCAGRVPGLMPGGGCALPGLRSGLGTLAL
ncbi:hypothetical protein FZ928_14440 [Klebsiella pneumoniae]|uniref:Uncharacterized protein n=1 Tax=Klebsiella pneumoniae TaxID=573 RepID=A0A5C2LJF1_KLEPN|nr:hypothetical protein FZ928_14440 [Klebsiella pneumoniae]